MFFDNYLTYNNKVIISVICAGIWIYFRTAECYAMIPRKSVIAVIYMMIWIYLYSYEPLFCPIGIIVLLLYTKLNKIKDFKL